MVAPEFKKQYEDIYKRIDYGSPYPCKALRFVQYFSRFILPRSKVLCVGCGNGYEVVSLRKKGFQAYGVDLVPPNIEFLKSKVIKAEVPHLPFKDKEFALVACCETLEHIPEEQTDAFINECRRVGERCFFSVATAMDPFHTHINIQEPTWWIDKLSDLKFYINEFRFRPSVDMVLPGNVLFKAVFIEGVIFSGH
jgi:ubiquinone/menaquinone biosynthesis C-methylase UbiE